MAGLHQGKFQNHASPFPERAFSPTHKIAVDQVIFEEPTKKKERFDF